MLHSNLNLADFSIEEIQLLLNQKKQAQENTIDGVKNKLEFLISQAINDARKEISQMYEMGVFHEGAINTNEKYISIGINLNHKVLTNLDDKKFTCNVQIRTKNEDKETAQKKANKDTAKSIKISSHKLKTSFDKSKTDHEKELAKAELLGTINKIAKRSGIPLKKTI
tara:strand:+ start:463 stop:966 length:504 start_codon:yes stop_codon:yes gene_type:complete